MSDDAKPAPRKMSRTTVETPKTTAAEASMYSAATLAEMEMGRRAVAAHALRAPLMEALREPEPETVYVERNPDAMEGFSKPGTPVEPGADPKQGS